MNNENAISRIFNISAESVTKELKNLNKQLGTTNEKVKTLGTTISRAFNSTKIIAFLGTIKSLTNSMIDLSKKQTEYIENLNLLKVAYDDVNSSGEKLVNHLASITGFDASSLTKSLGTFKQMSSALGIANESASLLSENLLKMQMDISSLYNLDLQRAGQILQVTLSGNTKSIRALGGDITEATLQQTAWALGIEKTVNEMNRAEKTMLIYLTIEKQLSNANGDMAKTINSVSNQAKIFKDQISILTRQIGAFFIPVLQAVLPILNGIMMALNTIIGVILELLGIDASSLASDFGLGTLSLENFNNELEQTVNIAKEANKSLRGFDKLNVIKTPTNNKNSGLSGIGGIDPKILEAMKEYNNQMDKMKHKANEIKESILGWLGFTKDLNGNWKFTNITLGTIIAGLGVALILFKGISKVIKVIGGVKGIFSSIGNLSSKKATSELKSFKVPNVRTILKGLVDLGLIIGGVITLIAIIKQLTKIDGFEETMTKGLEVLATVFLGLGKIAIPLGFVSLFVGVMGSFPVSQFLKGLASFGLVIDGIPILIAAIGALVSIPYVSGFITTGIDIVTKVFNGLYEIIIPLSVFSAYLVGAGIAFPVILSGLGSFATVITATGAIMTAIGWLFDTFPNIESLIEKGGTVVKNMFEMLGEIGGSFVKGILETSFEALPTIGTLLSEFMVNATPFFEGIKGVDESVGNVTKNIAKALIYITSADLLEGIKGWGTGGLFGKKNTLVSFGKQLKEFAPYLVSYSNTISGINTNVVEKSASAAQALAKLENELPSQGGKWQEWFGEKDLSSFGKKLPSFAAHLKTYSEIVTGLNTDIVVKSTKAAETLVALENELPKTSGVWQAWFGAKELSTFSRQLPDFGTNLKLYGDNVSGLDYDVVTNSANAALSLAELEKALPSTGGWWQVIAGTKSLTTFGNELSTFGKNLKSYYDSIKDINTTKLDSVTSSLQKLNDTLSQSKKGSTSVISGALGGGILSSFGRSTSIQMYAEGGFPNRGDLFWANETKPEMVGTINNKPAVANNDQIVEAISQGVYRAMVSSGDKKTNVVIDASGDDSGLLNFITFKQRQQDRQYGL